MDLAPNIARLGSKIREAADKNHRQQENIILLAVSKTRSADEIRHCFELGITEFGENYLQEAQEKQMLLSDLPICWHFIGPIQSNKTLTIAHSFDWVHSIDRLKIARRLSEQRPAELAPIQCCIQVNIGTEESKAGISLAQLPELAGQVALLPQLQLRGLMAIPRATNNTQHQHRQFAQLRTALEQLQLRLPDLDTLSMGMSADMESAIAEGSTIVRIGTALFGPRKR
jgi:pyridoxal phosphate enzyme (YggS family)